MPHIYTGVVTSVLPSGTMFAVIEDPSSPADGNSVFISARTSTPSGLDVGDTVRVKCVRQTHQNTQWRGVRVDRAGPEYAAPAGDTPETRVTTYLTHHGVVDCRALALATHVSVEALEELYLSGHMLSVEAYNASDDDPLRVWYALPAALDRVAQ